MVFVFVFLLVLCVPYIRSECPSIYKYSSYPGSHRRRRRETFSGGHRSARVIVMASGFGARGSEGRCAPAWREFSKVRRTTNERVHAMERRGDERASTHAWKRFSIGSGDLGGERRTDRSIDRTVGFRTNERFGMTTRCVRGESVTTTGTACCLRD